MQIFAKLKLIDCPHCGHTDCLIGNGLRGRQPSGRQRGRVQLTS